MNTTNDVYNIKVFRNKTTLANPKLEFDLSLAIKASSVEALVSAEDCPVHHYKMCSDIACTSVLSDVTKYNFTGDKLTLGLGTPIAPTVLYLGAFNSIESKKTV